MAKPYTENFRQNLRELCELSSQAHVAGAAGISRVFLNKILQGHSVPSLDVAERIANAMNMPLEKLLATPKKMSDVG